MKSSTPQQTANPHTRNPRIWEPWGRKSWDFPKRTEVHPAKIGASLSGKPPEFQIPTSPIVGDWKLSSCDVIMFGCFPIRWLFLICARSKTARMRKMINDYDYIHIYVYIYIYREREREIYIYIYIYDITWWTQLSEIGRRRRPLSWPPKKPATWKRGWSKHGSSTIPSKHSTPQDLYSPCLNSTNHARTMFTPTMFSRRRRKGRAQ